MNKKEIGNRYEKIVEKYIEKKGYKILESNYRNFIGEIDIIAKNNETIIFIEVKSRKTKKYGLPREAVTKRKIDKIRKCSLLYIRDNNIYNNPLRFDVVEVYINEKIINHIKNAF
ncbi:MAG: YraN family protein [Eubacteriales bacterium]